MWYLIGAIGSAIVSLSCIVATAVESIKGKITLTSLEFWISILFHIITAVLAVWLATKI